MLSSMSALILVVTLGATAPAHAGTESGGPHTCQFSAFWPDYPYSGTWSLSAGWTTHEHSVGAASHLWFVQASTPGRMFADHPVSYAGISNWQVVADVLEYASSGYCLAEPRP